MIGSKLKIRSTVPLLMYDVRSTQAGKSQNALTKSVIMLGRKEDQTMRTTVRLSGCTPRRLASSSFSRLLAATTKIRS